MLQRRRSGTVISLLLLPLLVAGCLGPGGNATPSPSPNAHPYAGLEGRPLKALPPERVDDLLTGRGAGYALAAELNHYPGPRHVLDHAAELRLSPTQEQSVREAFVQMDHEARLLGRHLVEAEAALDRAFGTASITPADLERHTREIAALDGTLRGVHLRAHLTMKAVLTPEQVARYDELRGYAGASTPPADGHHGDKRH